MEKIKKKKKTRKEEKKRKRKKREKNGVFSGHYVIASSLPPERLRPNGYPRTRTAGTPHALAKICVLVSVKKIALFLNLNNII